MPEPISPQAPDAYRGDPPGHLPTTCPRCRAVLDHFLISPTLVTGIPDPEMVRPTEMMQGNRQDSAGAAAMAIPAEHIAPASPPVPRAAPIVPVPAVAPTSDVEQRLTVCVLLYGDFVDLHRRCLNSIVSTVPGHRLDLRVACNQVCPPTMEYLRALPITKVYPDYGSRRKYTAMREMFWDSACPITTEWIVWFDDDSYARDGKWLHALDNMLATIRPEHRVGMLGQKMYHPLQPRSGSDPRQWFRAAPWFRGRPFRDRFGRPAPNGNAIHFCTGGFFVLNASAMRNCDIPDSRLNHNGDVALGEQLWQNGWELRQFNDNKQYVHTSAHPRRGYSEPFPWMR